MGFSPENFKLHVVRLVKTGELDTQPDQTTPKQAFLDLHMKFRCFDKCVRFYRQHSLASNDLFLKFNFTALDVRFEVACVSPYAVPVDALCLERVGWLESVDKHLLVFSTHAEPEIVDQ